MTEFGTMHARVVAILSGGNLLNQVDHSASHSTYGILVDRTPFYATSGGQVADIGNMTSEKVKIHMVHAHVCSLTFN